MRQGAVKHPWWIAGLAGTCLFGLAGFLEAVSLLFFQGAMLQVVDTSHRLKMLARLDTALFLIATVVYGALGFGVGLLWWRTGSRVGDFFHRLLKKAPREARDFYELFIYELLSLGLFLGFVIFIIVGWRISTSKEQTLQYPAFTYAFQVLLYGLLFYLVFRLSFWMLNKIPSLPMLGFLRRPLFHGICGAVTTAFLLALALLHPLFGTEGSQTAAKQVYQPARRPNIIFIVLDTCRADHLSCYGYPRPTTPHIDEFMRDAVLFKSAITPSPWTLPSHASIFTGLYPRSHGATYDHFYLDSEFFTLAEFLRACGYTTVGFSANPMVGNVSNLDQGFDQFEEVWRNQGRDGLTFKKCIDMLSHKGSDKGARKINLGVNRWLTSQRNPHVPFFLFINFLETHGPYTPPRVFRDQFLDLERKGTVPEGVDIYSTKFVEHLTGKRELTDQELADLRGMYDAELAYLDSRMGELLDMLRNRNILDDALVIVVSDHGENLGEHRMVDHQLCIYDTLLWVPLAIRYPPVLASGVEVKELVQLTSLFPTLAEILGVPESNIPISFQTQSLLGIVSHGAPGLRVAFSEYKSPAEILKILRFKAPDFDVSYFDRDLLSARNRLFKYILTSNGTDELYDLASDPGETSNLMKKPSNGGHPLLEEIGLWQKKIPLYQPAVSHGIKNRGDKEALEKLRSLGYIQ